MTEYNFFITFSVRDYECDMQGIVNNAVYQNYLEHTRHEYLKSIGINFAQLAESGINLVVTRAELDYKASLKSGDHFTVYVRMEQASPLRIVFFQDIFLIPENRIIVQSRFVGTCLNKHGRPQFPDFLKKALLENAALTSKDASFQ